MRKAPVVWDASTEGVAADEAETIESLKRVLLEPFQTMFEDSGHAARSVHAKFHGVLKWRPLVLARLPPQLAKGVFDAPRSYPVTMRLSKPRSDMLPNSISVQTEVVPPGSSPG